MQKRLVNYLFFSFVAVLLLVSVVSAVWWNPSTWFNGRGITGNPVASATDYTSNLVAYWKFDEASYSGGSGQVKDYLGFSNGTPVSSPTIVPGLKGNAVRFTGAGGQKILISTTPTKFNLGSFTLSAWVKTSDAGTGRRRIFSQQNSDYYGIALNGNNLECFSSLDFGVTQYNSPSTAVLNNNQWHHVSCVRNTGINKFLLYIDGVNVKNSSITGSSSYAMGAGGISISQYLGGNSEIFTGLIDELRVYNTALTSTQINQVYDFAKPASSAQACTSFTYSEWSVCSTLGQQAKTILTRTPDGCTGGSPEALTRSCTYYDPNRIYVNYTVSSMISPYYLTNAVVNLSYAGASYPCNFISKPTSSFPNYGIYRCNVPRLGQTGIYYTLSSSAPGYAQDIASLGNSFNAGEYTASIILNPLPPTCTSFTYSDWSTCTSAGSQTKTILTSNPSGCSGGTPEALTRSCHPDGGIATASLSGLTAIYDGTPKSISVTTNPPGISTIVTYNGVTTPPTAAGSYAVTVTASPPTLATAPIFTMNTMAALVINKADQTIVFPTISPQVTAVPFGLSATSSSGLPVSFNIQADLVSGSGTIINNVLTATEAGVVTVRASQAGNNNYNPAPFIDKTISVSSPFKTVQIGEWANVGDSIQLAGATLAKVQSISSSSSASFFDNDNVVFHQTTSGGPITGKTFNAISKGIASTHNGPDSNHLPYFEGGINGKFYNVEYRGVTGSTANSPQARLVAIVCTGGDWIGTVSPCTPSGNKTIEWTKSPAYCDSTLAGSVNHPASEVVTCTYVPPVSTPIANSTFLYYIKNQSGASIPGVQYNLKNSTGGVFDDNCIFDVSSGLMCVNLFAGNYLLNVSASNYFSQVLSLSLTQNYRGPNYPNNIITLSGASTGTTTSTIGANVAGCSDTDADAANLGGVDYNERGTFTAPAESSWTVAQRTDYCVSAMRLAEYSCDPAPAGFDYNGVEVDCPGGCSEGRCIGSGTGGEGTTTGTGGGTTTTTTTGTGGSGTTEATTGGVVCADGCSLESGQCVPLGYRIGGKYCDVSKSLVTYKADSADCENNFECGSNVCVSNKCIEAGFLQKISDWFSNLFATSSAS
ncbi:MAG: LamG-like jellyroll fold domain-containing protein [Nanoarchaeota archaeon]